MVETATRPVKETWDLEGILHDKNLRPVYPSRWQRLQLFAGRLPWRDVVYVAEYPAGTRLAIIVHPQTGYSAVTAQLQTPSPVSVDNLAYTAQKVFAAATHDMWVELETPAKVIYGTPGKPHRGIVPFSMALVLPQDELVRLTLSGIKNVPELLTLTTPTMQKVLSPDLVWLGNKEFYDVAAVGISTTDAVRLAPSSSFDTPSKLFQRGLLYVNR